jgi:hypothetical protein
MSRIKEPKDRCAIECDECGESAPIVYSEHAVDYGYLGDLVHKPGCRRGEHIDAWYAQCKQDMIDKEASAVIADLRKTIAEMQKALGVRKAKHEDFEIKVGDTVINKSTGERCTVVSVIPEGVSLKDETGIVSGCSGPVKDKQRYLYAHYWAPAP